MLRVTPRISLSPEEIEERFVHASGPGGQNVNKVATAVQLRFDARQSPSLPEPVRARLLKLAGNRLTRAGVIIITARRFRSQERNRQDARERLASLIRRAAVPLKPRKKTRPPKSAVEKRLREKQRRARLKRQRGAVPPEEA